VFDPESLEQESRAFHKREAERDQVRNTLTPVLDVLAEVEGKLAGLSILSNVERYHLGRARVEILKVLKTVDKAAQTSSEKMHRATDAFVRER
jgi:hypothetical protein